MKIYFIIFDKKTIMRNSYKITSLIIFIAINFSTAQEKLKGNKVVVSENRNISEFNKIEVIDDLNVFLVYNENQSVEVESDSNLQEAIVTEVKDGTLTIRTNEIIGRNKALNIYLKINKQLQIINTYNKAKVSSKNLLIIDNLTINSFDNSAIDLKLNTKDIEITCVESSKLNLEILSESVIIRLEESANLKSTIDTKEIDIICLDKTTLAVNGSTSNLNLKSSGNSSFKGEKFTIKNAIIKANNSASIYVNVTDNLELYSNNSSELHLYSNPTIVIHEFYDKALIKKRELKQ